MIKISRYNRWKVALLIIAPVIFFIEKYVNAGIRLSDTNLYYAMGEAILQGRHLYSDIFFTNLPLFPYISAFYTLAAGKNLTLFYLTGTLEAIVCYALIFIIGYIKTRDFITSFLGAILFLYSFTILYISDSQTGVLTATVFLLLAYLYIERGKRYMYGGVFLALCFLTKAYFIPVIGAFFVVYFMHRNIKEMFRIVAGFIITVCLIAGPYILLAGHEMITQLSYAGARSVGFPKIELLKYIATFDSVLLAVFVTIMVVKKRNMLHVLAGLFFGIYFIVRGSMYPIYVCMIIPFLALSVQDIGIYLQSKIENKKIVPILVGCYIISMFFIYTADYAKLGIIYNIEDIVKTVQKEKPSYIYGVADLAPAVSQKTRIPLLNAVIDTNAEIFQKGFLNKTTLTKNAVQRKSIVITEGIYMPESNIDERVDNNTFDKKLLLAKCKQIAAYPVQGQELINRIYLFRCY